TANLTDFTDDTLAAFDIVAVHPDTFLLDQWDLDPTLAAQILRETAAARQRPDVTVADVLDQLSRSGTPRFSAHAAALHS
ncbi:MAG: PIN domain-containing protein, partial [Mycobacteriaceae bacterium]